MTAYFLGPRQTQCDFDSTCVGWLYCCGAAMQILSGLFSAFATLLVAKEKISTFSPEAFREADALRKEGWFVDGESHLFNSNYELEEVGEGLPHKAALKDLIALLSQEDLAREELARLSGEVYNLPQSPEREKALKLFSLMCE